MPTRVAFATHADWPDITADDRVLRDALVARGVEVEPAAWNDPSVDWSRVGLCLIRSTWDYHRRREDFLAWACHVSSVTSLWNPLSVVEKNTHKYYLRDLAMNGVATVPTVWLDAGSDADLASLLRASGWTSAVIKPAVGASSEGVTLVTSGRITEGQAHLDDLLLQGDVMVQPFLSSVRSTGEHSLVAIDGVVTHAWRRHSALDGADEKAAPIVPEPQEVTLAHAALAATPGPVLYARIDIIHDEGGQPLLSELELTEPSLALHLAPNAAARLADAIIRVMRSGA